MKKLWLSILGLSIFGFAIFFSCYADLPITQNSGRGFCYNFMKQPASGKEIIRFHADTKSACGWFSSFVKNRTTAGINEGWNGFVKIVNVKEPSDAFYLASDTPSRPMNFSDGSEMACYICGPEQNTNCKPNDPDPNVAAQCFRGFDKINCENQVDCSKVIDITECYTTAQGINTIQYNDLELCKNWRGATLDNFSGVGKGAYQDQNNASSTEPTIGKIGGYIGG